MSAPQKPVKIMSGMRATGKLHLGHYFGALKNWLKLQDQYQCFFGVMDLHSMTTTYKNTQELPGWTSEMYAEFLAWGIDPEKSTLFVQSKVPQHIELFMVFANLTPMGWLERVPTWKDAEEEARASDTHNLGRFSYPVLQAADVALYKGEKVPVGADQVAHLELTREIIRRFNHLYKGKWPEPAALLTETPSVPGLDGRKMSKSYGNGLDLSDEKKVTEKKIRGMPTDPARVRREDPGDPLKCNVFTYHKLLSTDEDLKWVDQGCRTAGIGCGDCKGRLAERFESLVAGPREKRKELLNNKTLLDSIIQDNCQKARRIAAENMAEVRSLLKI